MLLDLCLIAAGIYGLVIVLPALLAGLWGAE